MDQLIQIFEMQRELNLDVIRRIRQNRSNGVQVINDTLRLAGSYLISGDREGWLERCEEIKEACNV